MPLLPASPGNVSANVSIGSNFNAAQPAVGIAVGAQDNGNGNMVPLYSNNGALVVAANFSANVAIPYSGNTGSAVPAQAGYTGIEVGANLQGARGFDLDTSGSTHEYDLGVSLRLAGSGGSTPVNVSNPLSTQIIGNVNVVPAANSAVNISEFGGTVVTLGQNNNASSIPVALPAGQITAITPYILGQNNNANSVPVTLPAGVITALQSVSLSATANVNLIDVGGAAIALGQNSNANSVPVTLPTGLVTALTPYSLGQNSNANSVPVTLPSGMVTALTPYSLGQNSNANSVPVTLPAGVITALQSVSLSATANVNLIDVGGAAIALGQNTANNCIPVVLPTTQSVEIAPVANTASGWSVASFPANLTNTAVLVKTGAGKLGGYDFLNPNGNNSYIQVFDVAAANNVTLGSTTPTYVISRGANMAWNVEWVNGILHNNGIVVAASNTATGNGAPSNNLSGFFLYK